MVTHIQVWVKPASKVLHLAARFYLELPTLILIACNFVSFWRVPIMINFDTVDHSILLSRLSTSLGINGKALAWFRSYLHNRSQFISIDSYRSTNRPLTCGVPQGSVLGPILYLMFVSPVGCIMRRHGILIICMRMFPKFTSLSS